MTHSPSICPGDALLLVDIQNDFLPGGALAVPRGDEVVPILNHYIARFAREALPVIVTRDWHPEDHCSFHQQGGPWPRHCVMNTRGAAFPPDLAVPPGAPIISKATDRADDTYSEFVGTDLEEQLLAAGVKRLYIGGLATDYCVFHTVKDALARGFEVFLLRDGSRAINLEDDDGRKAEAEMYRLGAVPIELEALARLSPGESPLLTDYYQLTMLRGYFAAGMNDMAVFEFFVRRLPRGWNFLIAAGLEQVLEFLEDLHFTAADLAWLQDTAGFEAGLVEKLRGLRFTGSVHAMPEGTIFFPNEPILRVTAPLPQAQLVETRVVNLLHYQTLIVSKAVRCVLAAPGKQLIEFGLRRAHGAEAGLFAARACFLAGFEGSSDVLAQQRFGIPSSGTMAHSFVEACASEEEAFLRFARANRERVVLLIDTYDAEAAAAKVVRLAPVLRAEDIVIKGVRLDSGDLAAHARHVRQILDAGGLRNVTIFASGNIDEHALQQLGEAPIDAFGVGTRVTTSADAPYLDCAYKLQAYAGEPRCKHSEGKATWPGEKQVYRKIGDDGRMEDDTIALAGEIMGGDPLLECVIRDGRRTVQPTALPMLQRRVKQQLNLLPVALKHLTDSAGYPVHISTGLRNLAAQLGVFRCEGATGPSIDPDERRRLRPLHRIHADREPVATDQGDEDVFENE